MYNSMSKDGNSVIDVLIDELGCSDHTKFPQEVVEPRKVLWAIRGPEKREVAN